MANLFQNSQTQKGLQPLKKCFLEKNTDENSKIPTTLQNSFSLPWNKRSVVWLHQNQYKMERMIIYEYIVQKVNTLRAAVGYLPAPCKFVYA